MSDPGSTPQKMEEEEEYVTMAETPSSEAVILVPGTRVQSSSFRIKCGAASWNWKFSSDTNSEKTVLFRSFQLIKKVLFSVNGGLLCQLRIYVKSFHLHFTNFHLVVLSVSLAELKTEYCHNDEKGWILWESYLNTLCFCGNVLK